MSKILPNKPPRLLPCRHVFGAYCSEPWRLDKRFFGTGALIYSLESVDMTCMLC